MLDTTWKGKKFPEGPVGISVESFNAGSILILVPMPKQYFLLITFFFFDDLVCFSFNKRPNSNVKQPYLKNKRLNLDLKL